MRVLPMRKPMKVRRQRGRVTHVGGIPVAEILEHGKREVERLEREFPEEAGAEEKFTRELERMARKDSAEFAAINAKLDALLNPRRPARRRRELGSKSSKAASEHPAPARTRPSPG